MRRVILLGLVGIALLAIGSIAGIAYLTAAPAGVAPRLASSAERAGDEPEPAPAATLPRAPDVAPQAPAAAPDIPPAAAPPLAAPARPTGPVAPIDPDRSSEILRTQVSRRCGRLSVRYVPGPDAAAGAATLSLDLEPRDGEVRIRNSSVRSPGTMRPALVACAQWAMRGIVLPAPGVAPGKAATAFVSVGMDEAAAR